jgi:hypothetical protein
MSDIDIERAPHYGYAKDKQGPPSPVSDDVKYAADDVKGFTDSNGMSRSKLTLRRCLLTIFQRKLRYANFSEGFGVLINLQRLSPELNLTTQTLIKTTSYSKMRALTQRFEPLSPIPMTRICLSIPFGMV